MSGNNPEDLVKNLTDTFAKLLQTPGTLKQLGIPDYVRVSPKVWDEINHQTDPSSLPPLPFGLRVELDPDLTGDQWELGPRRPSEAQPSEGNAGGSGDQ